MARPPRRQAGFTLVELIVVTLISGLMFVSLAAFYASGIRFQIQSFNRTVIQNRGLVATKVLQSRISQATVVTSPAFGAGSTLLVGGINVREEAPGIYVPILAAQPQSSFVFCVSNNCPAGAGFGPRCLWLYEGGWPPPGITALNCGLVGGGQVIASPVNNAAPNPFIRGGLMPAVCQGAAPPALPRNVVRVCLQLQKWRPAPVNDYETRTAENVLSLVNLDVRTRLAMY